MERPLLCALPPPHQVFEKSIRQCGQARGRDLGSDGGSDSMCPQGALQKPLGATKSHLPNKDMAATVQSSPVSISF